MSSRVGRGPAYLTLSAKARILGPMPDKRVWPILTVVMGITILVLSLLPHTPPLSARFDYADKVVHLLAYTVLGLLLFLSLERGRMLRPLLIALAGCFAFGGLIEYLQSYTGRAPEILDLVADLLGAACGAGIGAAALKRRAKGGG